MGTWRARCVEAPTLTAVAPKGEVFPLLLKVMEVLMLRFVPLLPKCWHFGLIYVIALVGLLSSQLLQLRRCLPPSWTPLLMWNVLDWPR